MKVLVTGASGFVGRALVRRLGDMAGVHVVAAVRRPGAVSLGGGPSTTVMCVGAESPLDQVDWSSALGGVDGVVHLAARVHMLHDESADPLAACRAANVAGTLNLARQCVQAGVKRFIFLSSIKVNGEATRPGQRFAEWDAPAPRDAYAISKLEAEQGLHELSAPSGMEVVIIRPPLVYGRGVKANFAALVRGVQCGWPLPLGAICNQRSLVALDNLVDLIAVCLVHPGAANETFLVSDGQDLSTPDLIRGIAHAVGAKPRLLRVPVWALRAVASLLGKRDAMQRLCGDLQVDIDKARRLLGWSPPVSVDEGLRRALSGSTAP